MKAIYSIMLIATVAGSFGCKKFLDEDPRGLLSGDAAIADEDGLNAQLSGAYSTLIGSWDQGFATAAAIASTMGGDDVTTHPESNKADFREFDQFNVTSFNARSVALWNGCYKTIQSSNNIINNYATTAGNEDNIKQIVGEAYFLRAFSYYYLVRFWGKIPIITTEVYSPDLLTVARNEITDVYKLIEEDLNKAKDMIGNTKLSSGRINKGTVLAYLADVCLTQTGWPVKNSAKAAEAAGYAKQVMDNKATYGFDLYQGGFLKMFAGGTPEEVFALQTDGNVTENLFYGQSGQPVDIDGWNDFQSEINFFIDFPAGERKDATFLTSVEKNGQTIQWQNFELKHPYYKKFWIQDGNAYTYHSKNPIILMRYAEVLLIYAEAQARSANPDASAYNAINAVRQRAGLGNLTAGLNSDDFIKAVIQERAWEFAAEWHRWFDIVRAEIVQEANANRHANEISLIGNPGDQSKWLLPIPAGDASINPNLK
ncbi:MAG: RagB/SusD family nutrient uptake outer membrane protein [Chitinophagaceae bacterium]|nr:RagB/SusD family nutrient uptake outer membrane protein [Chitinophagaceae bacterium]